MDEEKRLETLLAQIRVASAERIISKPQALVRLELVQRIIDQLKRLQRSEEQSDRRADDR
ncbi:hypothetical protein EDF70_12218 [Neorhizobium sp. JUb45]|nr:hypothetical protein EDF70_12218 [Neorhizobium sp. JUb45]